MLRRTPVAANTFLTWAKPRTPIQVIHSGTRHWSDPDRLVRMKLMYYNLGLDQQALRRTAVIQADKARFSRAPPRNVGGDPSGFGKARVRQMLQWHRRLQYQEFFLQHALVRQSWRVLRKYPVGGAKIEGAVGTPYFGYPHKLNKYTREPLPAEATELYPRRSLNFKRP